MSTINADRNITISRQDYVGYRVEDAGGPQPMNRFYYGDLSAKERKWAERFPDICDELHAAAPGYTGDVAGSPTEPADMLAVLLKNRTQERLIPDWQEEDDGSVSLISRAVEVPECYTAFLVDRPLLGTLKSYADKVRYSLDEWNCAVGIQLLVDPSPPRRCEECGDEATVVLSLKVAEQEQWRRYFCDEHYQHARALRDQARALAARD